MKKIISAASIAAVLALACPAVLSAKEKEEKEQTVQMSELPDAVQKTIKAKAGKNQIVRIEKETEHGKTVYEAVISKNGKETGIEVDQNGKYLNTHDESKEHKEKNEKH